MNSRQRGAAWVVAALLAGRVLDRFDLPFERRTAAVAVADSVRQAAAPAVSPGALARPDSAPHPEAAPPPAVGAAPASPLRLNQASTSDLQRLPGVGPVLAGRIVAHRAAHGPFRGLDDLRAVRGVGAKTCARLAPLVRFD